MTLKELCTELHYSENTFKRSFNRTCEVLKRKKVLLLLKLELNQMLIIQFLMMKL